MKEYDVVVIGAGPAGGAVASPLAEAGKKVAMIEADGFGGVCPLRGCNPKKVLLAAAETVARARHMVGNGVTGIPDIDWSALAAFRDGFVLPVPERAEQAYRSEGIDTYHGFARFTSPDTVEAGGETFTAEHFCICVGQKPHPLQIPGAELLSTSDDFLALDTLPNRIAFIGGGYIALELAHIAVRADTDVTLLNRSERVLRSFDPVLTDMLVDATREAGIDVRLNTSPQSVERIHEGLRLHLSSGRTLDADMVVNCTGRKPALEGLGLSRAEVDHTPRGITVNHQMQSVTNPKVYAIGDVAETPYPLTPTASHEGAVAAANILSPRSAHANYTGIPRVAFTIPPIAAVGLGIEEAEEKEIPFTLKEYDLGKGFPWKRLGEKFGYSRVLLNEKEDRVLGAHILGHHAEEIANQFALIIRQNVPLSAVRDTLWAYPTSGYYLKFMVQGK